MKLQLLEMKQGLPVAVQVEQKAPTTNFLFLQNASFYVLGGMSGSK